PTRPTRPARRSDPDPTGSSCPAPAGAECSSPSSSKWWGDDRGRGRMSPTRTTPRLLALALLALLLPASTSSVQRWEHTRKQVIDPLNTALHRHLPKDIQSRDVDA